jgi:transcriptional regulator with XRE-family HTH domain
MAKASSVKRREAIKTSKHSAKVLAGAVALSRHFGRLVANHRHREGISQQKLSERAGLSPGMVAKIESGVTGVRFPVIIKIAHALDVDPIELFYSSMPKGKLHQGKMRELIVRLEGLSETELEWVHGLLTVALKATAKTNAIRPVKGRREPKA